MLQVYTQMFVFNILEAIRIQLNIYFELLKCFQVDTYFCKTFKIYKVFIVL